MLSLSTRRKQSSGDVLVFGILHIFKVPGRKHWLPCWICFTGIIAACILWNISQISCILFSSSFFLAWPEMLMVSANRKGDVFPNWCSPCQPDEGKLAFINNTVPFLLLWLLLYMCQAHFGFWFNRSRTHKIYISITCKMDNGMICELLKLLTNISEFGTQTSTGEVNECCTVCMCGEHIARLRKMC